jgi:hypothetical protein
MEEIVGHKDVTDLDYCESPDKNGGNCGINELRRVGKECVR